jgi:hypothetical protein
MTSWHVQAMMDMSALALIACSAVGYPTRQFPAAAQFETEDFEVNPQKYHAADDAGASETE